MNSRGSPELLKVFLIERDPFKVEDFVKIFRCARTVGIRAWLMDVALWDIIGKATGQPIYRLLGGYRDWIEAYASTGEIRDPRDKVENVLTLKEEGFNAVKLRIRSKTIEENMAVVEAVRARWVIPWKLWLMPIRRGRYMAFPTTPPGTLSVR